MHGVRTQCDVISYILTVSPCFGHAGVARTVLTVSQALCV